MEEREYKSSKSLKSWNGRIERQLGDQEEESLDEEEADREDRKKQNRKKS